jgi:hypothetical protein
LSQTAASLAYRPWLATSKPLTGAVAWSVRLAAAGGGICACVAVLGPIEDIKGRADDRRQSSST